MAHKIQGCDRLPKRANKQERESHKRRDGAGGGKSAITHKVGGKRTIFVRAWKGGRGRSKRKILREALEKGG